MSLISLLIASNFLCKYKYESQQYFSLHTDIVTEPITTDYKFKHFLKVYFIASSFSFPSQQRNHEDNGFNKFVMFVMLIQVIKMEVEPCANSMWTESIINNCYTGQMEHVEGHARLSLQMTLQKPYIFVSHCQCYPSESEQVILWHNLMSCLLPSLAILDESIKTLSNHFNEIK